MENSGTLMQTSSPFSTLPSLTRGKPSSCSAVSLFEQSPAAHSLTSKPNPKPYLCSKYDSFLSSEHNPSLNHNPNRQPKRQASRRWRQAVKAEASGSILEDKASSPNLPLVMMASPRESATLSDVSVSEFRIKPSKGLSSDLSLVAAVKVIPHPDKVEKGGEDAYFVQTHEDPVVLCVADGVGGWANDGVDPSLYSREFVKHAQEAVENSEISIVDPRDILHTAHEKTLSPGATTCIVATLGEERNLRIACLGDSGLRIIRNGQVVFGTPAHQHYFDCPYQFGSESPDTAGDAQIYSVGVQAGDTVVVASDGLFDNVFDRDIAAVVSVFGGDDVTTAQHTAAALAALASKHSGDRTYESPYSQEAIAQGQDLPLWQKILGRKLAGGKPDDITVVVAHVLSSRKRPDSSEQELDGIVAAV